ncbi:MAG: TlpA family protein disulfide reductase [Bacteroidales bacterium]|nr:TlpA family protein disulfide reductase [Candidatus Cryptobacteroides caccocaballi]
MKKVYSAVIIASCIVAACSPKAQFSGNIDGVDELGISFASDLGTALEFTKDVELKNGSFSMDISDESGDLLLFDKSDFLTYKTFYFVPDEKLVITGTMTDYTISGSQFYQDMGEFHEMTRELDAKVFEALLIMDKAEREGTRPIVSYEKVKDEVEQEKGTLALDYIKTHPDSDFSAYLVSTLRVALFDRGETLLTERARNGKMSRLIDKKHVAIHGAEIAKQAKEYIKEGVEAPDFTLKTIDGEDWKLSDHRGGYVMLDFWGTWCHWCVEGMPEVRKVSDAYADKLTVVSVDCRDSEIEWKKGLGELEIMNWTQVYNPAEFALDAQYAVEGFPSFYIIDPEGKIVKIFVGETDNFLEDVGACLN